jgi:bifunctional enzyme CysN/CysC
MIQKKIVVCGSVDDGKSTLTGRIYFETGNISLDQIEKIKKISKKTKRTKESLDLTFFNDGLEDEVEQGITIDVSHKYLDYKNQRFIFHDSPGHNQYTRNVITAASECQIAIVLIDASKGILEQTKRHIQILDFLQIKNVIFALNKIDLIKYNHKNYLQILNELKEYIFEFKFSNPFFVPVSALQGINIVKKSSKKKWYNHKSILNILKDIKLKTIKAHNFFSVQTILKHRDKRIYYGNASGKILKNENILILPSQKNCKVTNVYTGNKNKKYFLKKNQTSLELSDHFDIGRGNIFTWKNTNLESGDYFNSKVVLTSKDSIYKGREYIIRIVDQEVPVIITKVKGVIDVHNHIKRKSMLNTNDFGIIEFQTRKPIIFSEKKKIDEFCRFIFIDNITNNVIAAGKINFKLRKSEKIFPVVSKVTKYLRSKIKKQQPFCIWLTGRSGSGKSTLANKIEEKLLARGFHTYILDGDNIRSGLNNDLGFKSDDRVENIRRIAEVSKLFIDSGLIVIVAAISPFARDRLFAKSLLSDKEFYEIHINTPLSICEKRDKKNLYKSSSKNKKFNNIGLKGVYEDPKHPFLKVSTEKEDSNDVADKILNQILNKQEE